ncbi:hypothetical protein K08M3_51720 [Vibrio alginolyticus]|uniref:Uncharacterized protein n=1 Tax=Vibrio alginolyticus TaxID=663 RepID=A0A1W6U1D0_VIBAL|nr:hypothetical protein K04M1_51290 [Vibrio alginolyticus]ARP11785.1 hypothetical protein K04M3_52160 [Vibrio alginolyticus]ARP16838.1 hypothetical protein K04M5_51860 [Vibrio alginolyticus]ARP21875.1 hypothetical protein K05K4_51730 [Vibrio alginolyticus]ARP26963.1 hypothetical protein K06K5_51630 [Vibrio alginolyticus]
MFRKWLAKWLLKLAKCKRKGVSNTDSFAGVPIVPSESNRFMIC